MKKQTFSYLFIAIVSLIIMTMTSCKKDEFEPVIVSPPTTHSPGHVPNGSGPVAPPITNPGPQTPVIVPGSVFVINSIQIDGEEVLMSKIFPGVSGTTNQMRFSGSNNSSGLFIKEVWDAVSTGGYVPDLQYVGYNFSWAVVQNNLINLAFNPTGNSLVAGMSGDYNVTLTVSGLRLIHKNKNIIITLKH